MINVRHLFKSFNGVPVLEDINLDIDDKKTLVILGPSGQGKTVLIKTMVRLIEPDSGSVSYDGVDIFKLPRNMYKELQKKMAFVFQANALFDFLNVHDNLSLFLTMHTMLTVEEIEAKVAEAMCFVGLDSTVLTKFPEELSGGMGKRVAIARAMILRPEIIFYDEPTAGLDEGNVDKVEELMTLLKNEVSATTVIVTHDVDLMFKVSDDVALLKEGRIVFSGKKEQVTEAMLRDLYATGENNGVQK